MLGTKYAICILSFTATYETAEASGSGPLHKNVPNGKHQNLKYRYEEQSSILGYYIWPWMLLDCRLNTEKHLTHYMVQRIVGRVRQSL